LITNLIREAHQLAIREQLSWIVALIAVAAIRSRCAMFCSEDFSYGRRRQIARSPIISGISAQPLP